MAAFATALAIWITFLSGSSAQYMNHRCYACGPQANHWYANDNSPPCTDMKEEEAFIVDCGEDYASCALLMDSSVVSRVCSKNATTNCLENDVEIESIICTCNESLCNGIAFGEHILSLKVNINKEEVLQNTNSPLTLTQPEESANENGKHLDMTTSKVENIAQINTESPPILKISENQDSNDVNNGIHIMPQKLNEEAANGNSLPLPAALGQQNEPNSQQGAPVDHEDDEEDAVEGSGNRVENETKIHSPITTTTETSTTTEKLKNFAPRFNGSMVFKLLSYILLIYNLKV